MVVSSDAFGRLASWVSMRYLDGAVDQSRIQSTLKLVFDWLDQTTVTLE
jgi:hypothetical protein